MKRFFIFLSLFGILALPGEAAQETDIRKAIIGHDPEFDVRVVTNPLNHFIKDMFRPTAPVEEPTAYEEAVPSGIYYRNEGRFYEKEPSPEKSPKEETSPTTEKSFYEEGGLYYRPPKEK